MGSQGTYETEQSSRSRVLIRRIDVEVPLSPSAPVLQDGDNGVRRLDAKQGRSKATFVIRLDLPLSQPCLTTFRENLSSAANQRMGELSVECNKTRWSSCVWKKCFKRPVRTTRI
jgi:hypothetical protein